MDELNRRLAEWVGFRLEATGVNKEIPVWIEPSGVIPESRAEYYFSGKNYGLPDFASSLDLCFKWLVPKLSSNLGISIGKDGDRPYFYCRIEGAYFDSIRLVKTAETPALALCEAIEQLIDKES